MKLRVHSCSVAAVVFILVTLQSYVNHNTIIFQSHFSQLSVCILVTVQSYVSHNAII